MKFSFLSFFKKSSKKPAVEENNSAGENSDEIKEMVNSVVGEPKRMKFSSLLRIIIISSVFFIVLLLGVIAGLLIYPTEKPIRTVIEEEPIFVTRTQNEPKYNALDPVSADWGITMENLASRINVTLEKVGIRSGKIVNFRIAPGGKEFRHSFSQSLLILGELSDVDNVRRAAVFYDPAADQLNFPLAIAVIRALIAAVDPSLTREDIFGMMDSLEISSDVKIPQRQAFIRHRNFIFRIWSVAGSAFVFTASSD